MNSDRLSYLIISDSYANKNTLDIWIKFSQHLRDDEILCINELKHRDISCLSQSELDKYYNIKKQLNVSGLFIKYKNRECSKEEHDNVFEFMNQSLRMFVDSRMSEEEKAGAQTFVKSLTRDALEDYVNNQKEIYEKLSAYDAYVLFIANEYLYNLRQKELNEMIMIDTKKREASLRKRLVRDYGIF